MKLTQLLKPVFLLYVTWFLAVFYLYYLFTTPADDSLRRIQGTVRSVSSSELILDITKSLTHYNLDKPDTKQYRLKLSPNTYFIKQGYVYKDRAVVGPAEFYNFDRTDLEVGAVVYVHFNAKTGTAQRVYVGDPTLWF